jgi:hypothetical protein
MPSGLHHRRLLLPALVALVIGVQATGAALALAGRHVPVVPQPAVAPVIAEAAAAPAQAPTTPGHRTRSNPAASGSQTPPRVVRATAPVRVTTPTAQTAAASLSTAPRSTPKTPSAVATPTAGTAYRGTNHVWIPALGINRDVAFFPCSRTKPPGHQIYSWGCAGKNNVYLFGHAASVMKPLHDAYYSKRLKVGMRVVFADGNGKIRTYKVTFWKVVSPVDAGWAFAAQSRPSMTLQTCVGAQSQWRLVVRLVQSG